MPTFTAAAAVVSKTDLVASLPGTLLETLAQPLAPCALTTPLRPVSATMLWHECTDADPALRAFRATPASGSIAALARERRARDLCQKCVQTR